MHCAVKKNNQCLTVSDLGVARTDGKIIHFSNFKRSFVKLCITVRNLGSIPSNPVVSVWLRHRRVWYVRQTTVQGMTPKDIKQVSSALCWVGHWMLLLSYGRLNLFHLKCWQQWKDGKERTCLRSWGLSEAVRRRIEAKHTFRLRVLTMSGNHHTSSSFTMHLAHMTLFFFCFYLFFHRSAQSVSVDWASEFSMGTSHNTTPDLPHFENMK